MRGSSAVSLMFFLRCIAYLSSSLDRSSTFVATFSHKVVSCCAVPCCVFVVASLVEDFVDLAFPSSCGSPLSTLCLQFGVYVSGAPISVHLSSLCIATFLACLHCYFLRDSLQFAMRCLRMVFSGSFALRCDELKPFSLSFFSGVASAKNELLLI